MTNKRIAVATEKAVTAVAPLRLEFKGRVPVVTEEAEAAVTPMPFVESIRADTGKLLTLAKAKLPD